MYSFSRVLPRRPRRPWLALLSACSAPYHPPYLPQPASYPGLIDLAARADGRVADVLLVHGICTHDASWAAEVVPQLAAALDAATSPTLAAAAPASPLVSGAQVELVPIDVQTPAGRLRFQALIWSPLTNPLKRQLCDDQSGKSALCGGSTPYPYTRARLNARFKDGLIDDCLPDALIYQGVARDAIQRQLREALLRALPGDAPLVVISHSMGSKMLFDTLLRMTEEADGTQAATLARQAVDRMRLLVMAANQIPLLSLADQSLSESAAAPATAAVTANINATAAEAPPDSLQLLLRQRQDRRALAADRQLTLVAFTDPNDLLSYTLPPEKYAQDGVTVYNILVSNAPAWLGLLERPDRAHLDYLRNPDVGRLIACGQPTSKLCN